jgi:Cd2+/Zn2+-exporting ATPase
VSVTQAYGRPIVPGRVTDYEEIAGRGVRARMDGMEILAGNSRMMDEANIACGNPDMTGTVVYIAADSVFAGYIVIEDEVKPDSFKAIADLRAAGVKKIAMLTGDTRTVGEKVGRELGVDQVYTELLPWQKVEKLDELDKEKSGKGKLIFIGDGINDAPVLARADVGVAMGGLGSDAAIEAADVVLMTDEPSKIAQAIGIAKKTRGIVWQNIVFALAVKGIILALGAVGIATMWAAVFGDVGVAVIAILNAMRAMKTK